MKHMQSGFSLLIALCALLVLGVIGFMILGVIPNNEKKTITSTPISNTRLYTDTAHFFTFEYPDSWKVTPVERGGTDGPVDPEPDWTKVSQPVLLTPGDGHNTNNVRINPGCETQDPNGKTVSTLQNLKDRKDRFHTQQPQTINGYQGLYDKLDFKGDAESYLDHTYFVTDGKSCVTFIYRERWKHDMSNTDFNDTKNVPAFQAVVQSIKFL